MPPKWGELLGNNTPPNKGSIVYLMSTNEALFGNLPMALVKRCSANEWVRKEVEKEEKRLEKAEVENEKAYGKIKHLWKRTRQTKRLTNSR